MQFVPEGGVLLEVADGYCGDRACFERGTMRCCRHIRRWILVEDGAWFFDAIVEGEDALVFA